MSSAHLTAFGDTWVKSYDAKQWKLPALPVLLGRRPSLPKTQASFTAPRPRREQHADFTSPRNEKCITLLSGNKMSATCNFPETPGSRTPAGGSPLRAHARVRNGGQIRLARGGLGVLPVCVRVRPECEHGRTPNEAREDDSVPDLIIFLCCSANMPPTPSDARFRRRLRLPEEFIEDGRAPGGQGFHVRAENRLLHEAVCEATESLGHCPLPVLPAGPGPLAEHQLDNSVAILDARTLRI